MKLTQCEKGHFYDAEKFAVCPHCQGSAAQYGGAGDEQKTCGIMSSNYSSGYYQNSYGIGFNGASDMNESDSYQNRDLSNSQKATAGPSEPHRGNVAMGSSAAPEGSEEGKTMAYFQYNGANSEAGNSSDPSAVRTNGRPVVGWLVCIEGNNYGRSFNLYAGKNFVGRSSDMDVCIRGDESVSRVRHAIITYEPKERKFFAQPGESHELFYVNDSVVLTSASLEDRDVISIGKTVLVFVPFCDERYGWEK